jgi:hypothetical protein
LTPGPNDLLFVLRLGLDCFLVYAVRSLGVVTASKFAV